MSKNGSPPTVLMHVDQSLTLWAFLDVYGSTRKIRMLGSTIVEPHRSGKLPIFIILLSFSLDNFSLQILLYTVDS